MTEHPTQRRRLAFASLVLFLTTALSPVHACEISEKSFRMPNGTGITNSRILRAIEQETIKVQDSQLNRQDVALWMLTQHLNDTDLTVSGEYYLFDIYGSHFTHMVINKGRVTMGQHKIPPLGASNVVLLDIRVLEGLLQGQLSFTEAQQSGLLPLDPDDAVLGPLLNAAFN